MIFPLALSYFFAFASIPSFGAFFLVTFCFLVMCSGERTRDNSQSKIIESESVKGKKHRK